MRWKMKALAGIVTLVWALALPTRADSGAEILDNIPGDVTAALVVRSVTDLDNMLHTYAHDMGIPLAPEMLPDFLAKLTIAEGFGRSMPAAVVAAKGAATPGHDVDAKAFVLLVPATNPKTLLKAFKPSEPEGGISSITLPNQAESAYAAVLGNFVALAQSKDTLAGFVGRQDTLSKLSPRIPAALDANDVILYVNIPAISARLQPQAKQMAATVQTLMQKGVAGMTAEQRALQSEQLAMVQDGLAQYLQDTQAAILTARLQDAGLTLGLISLFKPESTMAKLAAAHKAVPPATFNLLPSGEYLAAGALTWDNQTLADWIDRVTGRLTRNPDLAARSAQWRKMADLKKQIMALAGNARFALLSPPGADLKKLSGMAIIDSKDPDKLQDLLLQLARQPMIDPDPDVTTTITVESAAQTVHKVILNRYAVRMAIKAADPAHPRTPERQRSLDALATAQGTKGLVFYTGSTNKRLVILMGSDTQVLDGFLTAVQTTAGDITTQLAAAAPGMQPVLGGATAVAYLPVERWFKMALELNKPLPAPAAAPGRAATTGAATTVATPTAADLWPNASLAIVFSRVMGDAYAMDRVAVPKPLLLDLAKMVGPMLQAATTAPKKAN